MGVADPRYRCPQPRGQLLPSSTHTRQGARGGLDQPRNKSGPTGIPLLPEVGGEG